MHKTNLRVGVLVIETINGGIKVIYEFIFFIPEIILGIGIDFLLTLRFVKTKEIEDFKGDINIGPLNKKKLSAMSVEVKKQVTKVTQTGILTMLISTIVAAIFFVFTLQFSKWFAIPCIVIQFALTLFFYRQWREKIVKYLKSSAIP